MTATSETPTEPTEQKVLATKRDYRKKVWDHLQRNHLASFPRPVYGRIPNYKNANEAAEKLLTLEPFQNAKNVEVNPDKALEHCRILTLKQGKDLFVPLPKLKDGLLKKWSASENNNEEQIKRIVSRWGIEYTGQPIGLNSDQTTHIDLFVLGSVAVGKNGNRIGKGRGYADLEYAILKEMNAIDDDTTIITVVHDSQVFDELPDDLFQKYDVPVDYILTPTEIIHVDRKQKRPDGIFWNLLSERRLRTMDILVKLHEKQTKEGKETGLKQEESDTEEKRPPFRRFQRKRFPFNNRRRRQTTNEEKPNDEQPRRDRVYRRQRKFSHKNQSKSPSATRNQSNNDKKQQYKRKRRFNIDFSLIVSNISKDVRVRDLKTALVENGIKPYDIQWRGMRGFCYLHYIKPRNNNNNENNEENKPEDKHYGVDNVIDILQKMKITPDTETNLNVKVLEPAITRIETTDVTAV